MVIVVPILPAQVPNIWTHYNEASGGLENSVHLRRNSSDRYFCCEVLQKIRGKTDIRGSRRHEIDLIGRSVDHFYAAGREVDSFRIHIDRNSSFRSDVIDEFAIARADIDDGRPFRNVLIKKAIAEDSPYPILGPLFFF